MFRSDKQNVFGEEWKRKILHKAIIGYQRILKQEEEGKTARNPLCKETAVRRRVKKLTGKSNWFREKRKKATEPWNGKKGKKGRKGSPEPARRPGNVFFIPYTAEVELKIY